MANMKNGKAKKIWPKHTFCLISLTSAEVMKQTKMVKKNTHEMKPTSNVIVNFPCEAQNKYNIIINVNPGGKRALRGTK